MLILRMDIVSTQTVIAAYFELKSLQPNTRTWTERDLADNAPRLHRLLALKAMFRAYRISWDPEKFESGESVCGGRDEFFGAYYANTPGKRMRVACLVNHGQASWRHAFRFAQQLERVYNANEGLMMTDPIIRHVVKIVDETRELLGPKRADILDFLGTIISPEGALFSVPDLISLHGYPTTDTTAIDADNY